jgi:biopolymer transport protein ExbD
MLQRHRQSEEPLFINLTPMIDVILTLLVFFITASRFDDWSEEKLDVAVPQVSYAKPLTQAPDDLAISIALDGSISYNGEPIELRQIAPKLRQAKENFPDQGVIVRGDRRTNYEQVANVISECHGSGINRILLSVQQAE